MNTTNQVFKGQEALKFFLVGNQVPTLTVLAKKEKLLVVGGFSEEVRIQNAEDYHLWLKLLINGCSLYGSEKTLASYRVHSKSSTSQDKRASKQLPEALFDLMQTRPEVRETILNALKRVLRRRHGGRAYTKSDLYLVIDETCHYLDKRMYAPFYKCVNFCLGTKATKKVLNHLLDA